jgi:hypothetical protein
MSGSGLPRAPERYIIAIKLLDYVKELFLDIIL